MFTQVKRTGEAMPIFSTESSIALRVSSILISATIFEIWDTGIFVSIEF